MFLITSSLLCCPVSVTLVERRKIGFLVTFLNVHEVMSAGSQESSDRHFLRTLVPEKLGCISEHGTSANWLCCVLGHWKARSKFGRQQPTQES